MSTKNHRVLFCILISTMVFENSQPSFGEEQEIESLLKEICLVSFKTEMDLAKKIEPKGMANFTCECFLEKLNLGTSIESSKDICKEQAAKEFPL